MGINKVQYGNTTLIDLTSDTVTADKLMQGYTAHDRTGTLITGTATGGIDVDDCEIIVDTASQVGTAQIGTAIVETANYVPSGDITLIESDASLISGATIGYIFSQYVLSLNLETTSASVRVPSKAIFVGSGTKLIIKEKETV